MDVARELATPVASPGADAQRVDARQAVVPLADAPAVAVARQAAQAVGDSVVAAVVALPLADPHLAADVAVGVCLVAEVVVADKLVRISTSHSRAGRHVITATR